ncbi:MAG TPA: SAM-dependent methyltransferase, partial [Trebonia sp.]|nr:SAM-dependent methyltransferase [Trebonia sp.]
NIVGRMSQQQYTGRNREQMLRFFTGMELVEPGLVRIEEWRPDPGSVNDYKSTAWAAVGRKS